METIESAIGDCVAAYVESCNHWQDVEERESTYLQVLIDDELRPLEELASKLRHLLCHELQTLGETNDGPDPADEIEREVERLRRDHEKLVSDELQAKSDLIAAQQECQALKEHARRARDDLVGIQTQLETLRKRKTAREDEQKNVLVAKKMNAAMNQAFTGCKEPAIYQDDCGADGVQLILQWDLRHHGSWTPMSLQVHPSISSTDLASLCWATTTQGLGVDVHGIMEKLDIVRPETGNPTAPEPQVPKKSRSSILL